MIHPDALVAVLDANVQHPQWLRDLMITADLYGHDDIESQQAALAGALRQVTTGG